MELLPVVMSKEILGNVKNDNGNGRKDYNNDAKRNTLQKECEFCYYFID